jgi:uncharacterized protein YlxW (UPF0749 family)
MGGAGAPERRVCSDEGGQVRQQVRQRLRAALRGPSGRWRVLVPVVCLLAGGVFATSAHQSRGTPLRAPGTASLADLVRAAEGHVKSANAELAALQRQVSAATQRAGAKDSAVASAQARIDPLRAPGGLTKISGPGITVVLDDAAQAPPDPNVDPNQLLIHQSDLQAVVNALWAGGAEAMTISGQRVIATSAVRCVGNTLLLNGEVFSPPFRIKAIGSYSAMHAALRRSPGVHLFAQAASYYGLGYTVTQSERLVLPAYGGTLTLQYARAGTN